MAEERIPQDPSLDDFPTGPDLGAPVPAFTLPDQHGRPFTYRPDGKKKALILFHRSAAW